MNVLVISPTPTAPSTAGNRQRIAVLVATLRAQGHSVRLLLLNRECADDDAIAAMRMGVDDLIVVPHARDAERSRCGEANSLDDWFLPSDRDAIEAVIADHGKPDVVFVVYVFLSAALTLFGPPTLRVLDTHDVFAGRREALRAQGVSDSFFSTTVAEENRGFARADVILALQEYETRRIRARTATSVVTLGYWPLPAQAGGAEAARPATGRRVLQVGWLGSANALNRSSLARLLAGLEEMGFGAYDATFTVGGSAALLDDLPRWVHRKPSVASPESFFRELDLVVNPHEGGTGLKIKTVDALASGVPVIGTRAAFEGLGAVERWHAAEHGVECAALVMEWLANPSARHRVRRASQHVAGRYHALYREQAALLASREALASQARRPRILVVTDVEIAGPRLGNVSRITSMLDSLSDGADVDVLQLPRGPFPTDDKPPRIESGRRVFTAQPVRVTGRRPSGLTPFEAKCFREDCLAALEQHLSQRSYDGVIIEYIWLSYLRTAQDLPPVVAIDTHDLMSVRQENFQHFGERHFLSIAAREEAEIMSRFSVVITIQEAEHAIVEQWLPGRSVLWPYTRPIATTRRTEASPLRVVFVGGDSPMNRAGLRWFLKQVWPALQSLAEFHIVGGISDAVHDTESSVVVHGELDDLDEFLSTAAVAVNPVFFGGGLKIKTVDYLACGVPSVLTAEAAYGIPRATQQGWQVARNRLEMIGMIAALLTNREYRAQESRSARSYAAQHFGRDVTLPAVEALLALCRRDHRVRLSGQAGTHGFSGA